MYPNMFLPTLQAVQFPFSHHFGARIGIGSSSSALVVHFHLSHYENGTLIVDIIHSVTMSRQLATTRQKYWAMPCPSCKKFFKTRTGFDSHLANGDGMGGTCTERPNLFSQSTIGIEHTNRLINETNKPLTLRQQLNHFSLGMTTHDPIAMADHLLAPMPDINTLAQDDTIYQSNDNDITFDMDDASDNEKDSPGKADAVNDVNPFHNSAFFGAKYDCELPPATLYQIHLERTIRSHRNVDLSITEHCNDVVCLHLRRGVDIANSKLMSRSSLVKALADGYNLNHLKPKICSVKLCSGNMAHVAVFNLRAQIMSILQDRKLMKWENFANGYNPFTGEATGPLTDYGEIHTGRAFAKARSKYKTGPNDFLFPLWIFYDKTHADLFASNTATPAMATYAGFNQACRHKYESSRCLILIPNLSYSRGKGFSKSTASHLKLQDEHNCLKLFTSQMETINEEGGIPMTVMGKKVQVKVWLHTVTGDMVGGNDVCGHNNNHSSTTHPFKECHCIPAGMSNTAPDCVLFTQSEIDIAASTPGGLQAISKKPIDSAFKNVPLPNSKYGILYVCPVEMMHLYGGGVGKYLLDIVSDMIGPGDSNPKGKARWDTLHQTLVSDLLRQSETDFPRTSTRSGSLGPNRMTHHECVGNINMVLRACFTVTGQEILKKNLPKGVRISGMKQSLMLQLAYTQWTNENNPREEVENAGPLVEETMESLKKFFPRNAGNKWNIPKFHGMAVFPRYMIRFGSGDNINGNTGESWLKYLIKDLAKNTQMRPSLFAKQLGVMVFQEAVLNHAFHYGVKPALGLDAILVDNRGNLNSIQCTGQYTMTIGSMDHHGRGDCDVEWKSKPRNDIGIGVSQVLTMAVKTFLKKYDWFGQCQITGWTQAHIPCEIDEGTKSILFHANELTMGRPWYDWCMVQFHQDGVEEEESVCPGRLAGFFKFSTPGTPTPHLVEEEYNSPSHIFMEGMQDDTLYAVIHSAAHNLPMYEIENDFISPFTLGDPKDCIYILDAEAIIGPLSVFPNIGGNGNRFFAEIPKRKWGRYFGEQIDLNNDSLSMEDSMEESTEEEEDNQLEEQDEDLPQEEDLDEFYLSEDVETSGVDEDEGENDNDIEEEMEC